MRVWETTGVTQVRHEFVAAANVGRTKAMSLAFPVSGRLLLGYRSHNAEYYTVGIGGNGFAYALVHYPPGTGWRFPLVFSSRESAPRPQQPYHLILPCPGTKGYTLRWRHNCV